MFKSNSEMSNGEIWRTQVCSTILLEGLNRLVRQEKSVLELSLHELTVWPTFSLLECPDQVLNLESGIPQKSHLITALAQILVFLCLIRFKSAMD